MRKRTEYVYTKHRHVPATIAQPAIIATLLVGLGLLYINKTTVRSADGGLLTPTSTSNVASLQKLDQAAAGNPQTNTSASESTIHMQSYNAGNTGAASDNQSATHSSSSVQTQVTVNGQDVSLPLNGTIDRKINSSSGTAYVHGEQQSSTSADGSSSYTSVSISSSSKAYSPQQTASPDDQPEDTALNAERSFDD